MNITEILKSESNISRVPFESPTQFIELREVKLMPTESLSPYKLIFMVLEDTIYQRWKVNTSLATKHLIYKNDLSQRYTGTIMAQSLWEWPTNAWHDLRPTPWNGKHIPKAVWMARNLRLDRPGTKGEAKYYYTVKEHSSKTTPVTLCSAHRSVLCSVIIRKPSSC